MNADKEEQDVKQVGSELSPPELVQQAIECLPVSLEKTLNGSNFSFRHWTISDYSRAYTSGEITPRTVCHIFDTFFYNCYLRTLYISVNCFQSDLSRSLPNPKETYKRLFTQFYVFVRTLTFTYLVTSS